MIPPTFRRGGDSHHRSVLRWCAPASRAPGSPGPARVAREALQRMASDSGEPLTPVDTPAEPAAARPGDTAASDNAPAMAAKQALAAKQAPAPRARRRSSMQGSFRIHPERPGQVEHLESDEVPDGHFSAAFTSKLAAGYDGLGGALRETCAAAGVLVAVCAAWTFALYAPFELNDPFLGAGAHTAAVAAKIKKTNERTNERTNEGTNK